MKSAGSELALVDSKPDPRPFRDWAGLRAEYETSGEKCTLRYIANREHIPINTVWTRSKREGWQKRDRIVKQAVRNLVHKAAQKEIAIAEDKLAPWIELHKAKFIKRTFNAANRGVARVSKHQRDNKNKVEARDEANIAKALESLTRVGRLALGLGDGSPVTGVLNFSMLSNKTAIQINNQDAQ